MFQFVCQANQTICTLIYVNLYDNKTMCEFEQNQTICTLVYQFVCQFPEEYVVETMPPCMGHSWSPKSSFQATRESETGFLGWALAHARLGQAGQTGQARQARQGGRKLVPLAPI